MGDLSEIEKWQAHNMALLTKLDQVTAERECLRLQHDLALQVHNVMATKIDQLRSRVEDQGELIGKFSDMDRRKNAEIDMLREEIKQLNAENDRLLHDLAKEAGK